MSDLRRALQRSFPVTERTSLKFRVEAFNATNRVHLDQPGTNVSARSTLGKITSDDPRPRRQDQQGKICTPVELLPQAFLDLLIEAAPTGWTSATWWSSLTTFSPFSSNM